MTTTPRTPPRAAARRAAAAALLALSLAAPGAARADVDAPGVTAAAAPPTPRWQLRSWMATRWLEARSAAVLTTDPMTGWGLSVERRIATVALPGALGALDVSAELGFEDVAATGTTFQQLRNDLGGWMVHAGARARLPVWSWLHVGGRAAIGAGRHDVRIADMRDARAAIYDRAVATSASAGVGVTLLPRLSSPGSAPFFMGVEVELGYHAATATTVHATPRDRPPPELTIPAHYAALGDVDLDGVTLRVAATMGF